jgi:hypothetical protein
MTSLDLFEKGLKNGIIGNEAKKTEILLTYGKTQNAAPFLQ